MEFSNNQKQLIDSMIQQEAESIMDFYGDDVPGYNIFLTNHKYNLVDFSLDQDKLVNLKFSY